MEIVYRAGNVYKKQIWFRNLKDQSLTYNKNISE